MSVVPDVGYASLLGLLDDWRQLTLAENKAIRALDWDTLRELQNQKIQLQPRIARGEAGLFAPGSESIPARAAEKRRLRECVEELAKLEKQNSESLASLIASGKQRIENAGQSLRSLRVVQRAYAKASQSFWHSYS